MFLQTSFSTQDASHHSSVTGLLRSCDHSDYHLQVQPQETSLALYFFMGNVIIKLIATLHKQILLSWCQNNVDALFKVLRPTLT